MDPLRPEVDALFIVLVGNFNPAIFQPAWLGSHGLASGGEVDAAKIEIIRPEIATFDLGPFRFGVQLDRFQIETSQVEHGFRMRDLVGNLFNVLKETPIKQMGINRAMHFKMPSVEAWNGVGHKLVPKPIWEGVMETPGTMSVSVRGTRAGAESKFVQITVQPSLQVQAGVFVQTTEHFESSAPASWVTETLIQTWDASQAYGLTAANQILESSLKK